MTRSTSEFIPSQFLSPSIFNRRLFTTLRPGDFPCVCVCTSVFGCNSNIYDLIWQKFGDKGNGYIRDTVMSRYTGLVRSRPLRPLWRVCQSSESWQVIMLTMLNRITAQHTKRKIVSHSNVFPDMYRRRQKKVSRKNYPSVAPFCGLALKRLTGSVTLTY